MGFLFVVGLLILDATVEAVRVVGRDTTVTQGETAVLSCSLTDTRERLTQISWQKQTRAPPTEVNIRQQTEGSWKCEAEAHPAATLVWTRTDGPWPQSSVTADGPTLQVVTWTPSLNGLYQCEASNQYGSKYKLLHIHVAPDLAELTESQYPRPGSQSKESPAAKMEPLEKLQKKWLGNLIPFEMEEKAGSAGPSTPWYEGSQRCLCSETIR